MTTARFNPLELGITDDSDDLESSPTRKHSLDDEPEFLLAKSFSPDERIAFESITALKLYRNHYFSRGPHKGQFITVIRFKDAFILSGLGQLHFTNAYKKFVTNQLVDTYLEPGTVFDNFFGKEGRVYLRLNVSGLAVLVQLSRPCIRYS